MAPHIQEADGGSNVPVERRWAVDWDVNDRQIAAIRRPSEVLHLTRNCQGQCLRTVSSLNPQRSMVFARSDTSCGGCLEERSNVDCICVEQNSAAISRIGRIVVGSI